MNLTTRLLRHLYGAAGVEEYLPTELLRHL
jgi:hypothetical protein